MWPDMSLSYVFWHRPRPGADIDEYESALRAFHARLAVAGIPGFTTSWTVRLPSVPWLDARPGYEDRYLVADFTALGVLNEAAVAAPQKAVHDAAAVHTADGIAGIYRLIGGAATPTATSASWLSKPEGVTYQAFLDGVDIGAGALWQRQMTLGPTPEFQLVGGPAGTDDIEIAPL